jgi:hypothetical protein
VKLKEGNIFLTDICIESSQSLKLGSNTGFTPCVPNSLQQKLDTTTARGVGIDPKDCRYRLMSTAAGYAYGGRKHRFVGVYGRQGMFKCCGHS